MKHADLVAQLDSAIRFASPVTPAFLQKVREVLCESPNADRLEQRVRQFDSAIQRIAAHVGACCGGVDTEGQIDPNTRQPYGPGGSTAVEIIRKIDERCARSSIPPKSGDAYFVVGYEDTPGFAIAWSKEQVRDAICSVVYGRSAIPSDAKEELDNYMAAFNDDDHWSIDRSHWRLEFEIGGLEVWRFPASVLSATKEP